MRRAIAVTMKNVDVNATTGKARTTEQGGMLTDTLCLLPILEIYQLPFVHVFRIQYFSVFINVLFMGKELSTSMFSLDKKN